MFESFRRVRRSMTAATLLFLVLGVILVGWPGLFIQFACYIIGALLVAFGVITILGEIKQSYRSVLVLGFGVVVAAVGIVIIASPELVSSIVPIVFGLILLLDGAINVRHALGMRRYGEPWLTLLILGLITLVLGALILLHPYGTAELAFRIMGVALLYNAISDLFILYHVGRAAKKYTDADGTHRIIDVEARSVEDDDE